MNKHDKTKMMMARIGLGIIAVFVVLCCIGMVVGSKELLFASLFCLIIVPIITWCFIAVYQRVHKDDKETEELIEQINSLASEDENE